MEISKDIVKLRVNEIDMMLKLITLEYKEIKQREKEIINDITELKKNKEDLLIELSGRDFNASLLDDDWDRHGTLSMNTKNKKPKSKVVKDWMNKSKK
jgi:predicted PolB exonuclease-like 3'-5' exonuclease